jgi:hypothetical protein
MYLLFYQTIFIQILYLNFHFYQKHSDLFDFIFTQHFMFIQIILFCQTIFIQSMLLYLNF